MSFRSVIFDLDGTVIDSFYGIQDAFNKAFQEIFGIKHYRDIKSYIGPPIGSILMSLYPATTTNECELFVSRFKSIYDTISFKETVLYNNAIETLEKLSGLGKDLFIATNKRITPTRLILDHLQVTKYFKDIYCIDSLGYIFENKEAMLAAVLANHSLCPSEVIMIGDTVHDFKAAKENDVTFVFADFGYGKVENPDYTISDLLQVVDII